MKKTIKIKHKILGFERRSSGAFEYAWNFAKNLNSKGFSTEYFSHWWNSPLTEINLKDESSKKASIKEISEGKNIFHLHTHTWEHEGHLDKIVQNPENTLIYSLHAIIPYFHLSSEDKLSFLNGELTREKMDYLVKDKMDERQNAQLSAMEKSNFLFTISKNHKKVLELMKIEKPIYVFENSSDFDDVEEEIFEEAKKEGLKLRQELNSENVLVYCGNLYEKKGSRGIFESLNKIKKEYGKTKLILLGNGENQLENLLRVGLKKEQIKDLVPTHWINKNTPEGKKEFLKHYYASDILIQPMITEELYSKTVIDAMKIGLPTITCKSPYSLGTSRNGDEIFESYQEFKQNPEKVNEIVKLAKEKVKKENSWDSYISRMQKIIGD